MVEETLRDRGDKGWLLMDELREVERLRARVAELEAERDAAVAGASASADHRPRARWWGAASALMLVLACLLAPVSVASVWASSVLSDTNRYVETVTPLIDDPAVRESLATEVTAAVVDNLDLRTLTGEALQAIAAQPNVPPRVADALPALAVPITDGVEGFTRDQVEKVLASNRFRELWAEVNRVAHVQVARLLRGDQTGVVTAQDGTITLNLAPIIQAVKQQLADRGFGLANAVPAVDRTFVLVRSDAVTQAQGVYRLLNLLGVWAPIVGLVLLAGGVAAARDRRRAVLRGSLGVVAAMVALGVVLALARSWYVETTPGDVLTPTAAGDVFDTLVRFLRTSLRALAVVGLLGAFAAFLSGPAEAAVRTRAVFAHGLGSARERAQSAGWDTGRVGAWTFTHARALRFTAFGLGGLTLIFWSRPTAWVVVGVAAAVLVALVLIGFLATPPAATPADERSPAAPPPLPSQSTGGYDGRPDVERPPAVTRRR
jgi:hypothetical protein